MAASAGPAWSALSGLDAACLYLDTPGSPMNIVGTLVLDPSTAPRPFDVSRVVGLVRERAPGLPPLRRRVAPVPFGLGHPVWFDDPDFRAEDHVHRVSLPASRGDRALTDFVAEVAARPLDRSRPLWDLYVVEKLPDGRAALVMVLHHAAADGVSGAALMARLLDASPAPAPSALPPPPEAPGPAPGDRDLVADALWRAARPERLTAALAHGARTAGRWLRGAAALPPDAPLPFKAARTRLSGSVSRRRVVAYARARRADLEFVRRVLGGTLNDVVLAACTQSLRGYLLSHGERPRGPLLAAIPVSGRGNGGPEADAFGNRISVLFARLPVDVDDPVEQLWRLCAETRHAKRTHEALGGDALAGLCEWISPALAPLAARLYHELGLADLHPPAHNLVISNVPGPPAPLYAAGARLVAAYPHGPVMAPAALNLTVMSYVDSVDFGLLACPERVPHAGELATGWSAAVGTLVKCALEEVPDRERVMDSLA